MQRPAKPWTPVRFRLPPRKNPGQQKEASVMTFKLTSTAFPPGGEIPAKYTCEGQDVSPPLAWTGVPPNAKSLVLIIDDQHQALGVRRNARPGERRRHILSFARVLGGDFAAGGEGRGSQFEGHDGCLLLLAWILSRRESESNRRPRLCRPLHDHSAIPPRRGGL